MSPKKKQEEQESLWLYEVKLGCVDTENQYKQIMEYLVAPTIDHVWNYLNKMLNGEAIEVEGINKIVLISAVL